MVTIKKKNALKILYYMMAMDGSIYDEERSAFDEVGRLVDDRYDSFRADILWECQNTALTKGEGDTVFHLLDAAAKEFKDLGNVLTDDCIPGRLLVWNLLVVALSDLNYTDPERRLVDEAVRKLEIEENDFLQMEQVLRAKAAAERELLFLQQKAAEGTPDLKQQIANVKERVRIITANARDIMVQRG